MYLSGVSLLLLPLVCAIGVLLLLLLLLSVLVVVLFWDLNLLQWLSVVEVVVFLVSSVGHCSRGKCCWGRLLLLLLLAPCRLLTVKVVLDLLAHNQLSLTVTASWTLVAATT